MLRTLWQKIRGNAHKHVQFLPSIVTAFFVLFIPISIKNSSLIPMIAEANWITDGLVDGIDLIFGNLLEAIAWGIFKITGIVFVMSGWIFDNAVKYSLSGSLYSSFGFINTGWVFIRDLINSLFIFAVLFTAFKYLLSFTETVNTGALKKTLVSIVVAALLINFSLFFTKAAIDVSNFLSRAIYYTMENVSSDSSDPTYGPANSLAAGLQIQNLLQKEVVIDGVEPSNFRKAIIFLGGSAIHVMTTIMFFTMAFFFLMRILVLVLLMMTSPIYFISFVFKFGETDKMKKMWLDALMGQLLFPVIFMLIIYIAVTFVNSGYLTGASPDASFASGLNGGASGFATIINFAIVLYIMYMATKMSRQYAGQAGTMGTALAGKAAGLGFSTTAWAGRNTLGRWGGRIAESERGRKWASSDNKYKRLIGDSAIKGGQAMHKGNWDLRSSGAAADAYGFANAKTHQLKVGAPSTKNAKADARDIKAIVASTKSSVPFVSNKHYIDAFSKLSSEGKKKEVALQEQKINEFTTIEAKVAHTASKIGKNINEKEYKDQRDKLIAEIRTEYKSEPKKQKDLIEKLVGVETFKSDKFDGEKKKIAAAIIEENKDKPEEQKKVIREVLGDETYDSKAFESIKKGIESKINVNVVTKSSKTAGETGRKLEAANTALATAKSTGQPTANIETQITELTNTLEIEKKKFETDLGKVNPSVVRELAVEDIKHLGAQLKQAHLAAINAKMAKGEYEPEDMKALSDLIKDLRTTTEDTALRDWINAQMMKGTNGFDLEQDKEISQLLSGLASKQGAQRAEDIAVLKDIMRVVSNKEISRLGLDEIAHEEIMPLLLPSDIREYSKKILARRDPVERNKLEAIAVGVERGTRGLRIDPRHRDTFASAFRGENAPKKKAGNRNQNRPTP